MKSNDIKLKTRDEYRALMQKALKENDADGFAEAWDGMSQLIGADIRAEYDQRLEALQQSVDSRVLAARGVRQLTTEENKYYQKVLQAMQSADPKQALANLDVVMPKTVIDSVFEDLRTNHPLLSQIDFVPTAGAVVEIDSIPLPDSIGINMINNKIKDAAAKNELKTKFLTLTFFIFPLLLIILLKLNFFVKQNYLF